MTNTIRAGYLAMLVFGLMANPVSAQQTLNITVQNNQSSGGFYLTPFWFGIQDGSFDFFDGGNTTSASSALELLAEEGDVSGLQADFSALQPAGQQGVVLSPGGFAGAPVFDPGEIAMTTLTINDPMANRYFSFASMVIPTNDAFIGNDGATDFQLFDVDGNFNGPQTIQIFGSSIYDAGTEANDENGGAAFSANGGISTDEFLFVRTHPGLANFTGTFTVAGTEITSDIGSGELLATITIGVPEPGTFGIAGLMTASLLTRRRRT